MNNAALTDIKNLITEERFDLDDPADFIDFCNEIIAFAVEERNTEQSKINANVERLIDSFGGANCTMRSLKGE